MVDMAKFKENMAKIRKNNEEGLAKIGQEPEKEDVIEIRIRRSQQAETEAAIAILEKQGNQRAADLLREGLKEALK